MTRMERPTAQPAGGVEEDHGLGGGPLTIYPSGRCEVVFQHLARRAPFDDPALREELRQRLNGITGIDLPVVKIELRPSFPLDVLATPNARGALADQLAWFRATLAA